MEEDQFLSGSWSALVSQSQECDLPTCPRSARPRSFNYTRDTSIQIFDASRGEPFCRLSRKCGKDAETFPGRLRTPAARSRICQTTNDDAMQEREFASSANHLGGFWRRACSTAGGVASVSLRWAVQGGWLTVRTLGSLYFLRIEAGDDPWPGRQTDD